MDNKKLHARNGVSKQEAKKDTSGNPRQWPKNARRRESKVGQDQQQLRNISTTAFSQQQQHQYRHNNDRRARWSRNGNATRPAYVQDEAAGLVDPEEEEEEETSLETAEWDSVLVPGSKKHNLNHLLNFHYAPRDRDMPRPKRGQKAGAGGTGRSTASAVYNKDQFLQANCNFIVKDTEDYKAYWVDPDMLVEWQLIEEVVIRSSEEPKCPICLFPPVAAKMTKCGHVYCWPCILHYLALSDKAWRKCPICYDAVHIKDLRSTTSWPCHEYQLNETVDFQLMCRRKDDLGIFKVGAEEKSCGRFPHLFDVREQQIVHSKLILANQMEVSSILDREFCELQDQMRTDGPEGLNCPEIMFITQALDLLEERRKELQSSVGRDATNMPGVTATAGDEKLCLYDGLPENEADATEEFFYFYQAVDGQHLYMHSINLRMLQAQYGSLVHCPPVLTGRIVQREYFSVSEALRKRSKYLQHLPLTSIITIAEVHFEGELLSDDVREQFAEEVNQRKRDRQCRARDEKKREKQINDFNERQMGKFMSQSAGFVREELDYYPFLTNDEVDATEGAVGGFADSAEVAGSSTSPKPFSFAKMLQCTSEIEKAQPEYWPTLAIKKQSTALAAPSLVSEKPRASKMDKHFPNLLDTIDLEEEESLTWSTGGDMLARVDPSAAQIAPKMVATSSKSVGSKGNTAVASSKKTPKKKQQMLLFSTEMNFNRN